MKLLGVYASPRQGGNSDLLLDKLLEGAVSAGAEVERVYARSLEIFGCRECGGCDETGVCVVDDEMTSVYPLLYEAEVIVLAAPIFFYGPPAQAKALIDRCQAAWNKRRLAKGLAAKGHEGGIGYLIAIGATKGKDLFMPIELVARYFYDALDMDYGGGLFFRRLEAKGAVTERPETLEQAFEMGRRLALGPGEERGGDV